MFLRSSLAGACRRGTALPFIYFRCPKLLDAGCVGVHYVRVSAPVWRPEGMLPVGLLSFGKCVGVAYALAVRATRYISIRRSEDTMATIRVAA